MGMTAKRMMGIHRSLSCGMAMPVIRWPKKAIWVYGGLTCRLQGLNLSRIYGVILEFGFQRRPGTYA